MPERNASIGSHQHPRRQARLDAIDVGAADGANQIERHPTSDDRQRIEQGTGARLERRSSGEHSVAYRRRKVGACCGEHLGDEERVAAASLEQRDRIEM
jgi:hypothetical protein